MPLGRNWTVIGRRTWTTVPMSSLMLLLLLLVHPAEGLHPTQTWPPRPGAALEGARLGRRRPRQRLEPGHRRTALARRLHGRRRTVCLSAPSRAPTPR